MPAARTRITLSVGFLTGHWPDGPPPNKNSSEDIGMKCCKKTLVVAAVLAGGVALVAGTGLGRHTYHKAVAWAKKQIPIEDQIGALKQDIGRLDREIDSGWPKIAKYEGEIKDLKDDLEHKSTKVVKMEKEIAVATDALEAKV